MGRASRDKKERREAAVRRQREPEWRRPESPEEFAGYCTSAVREAHEQGRDFAMMIFTDDNNPGVLCTGFEPDTPTELMETKIAELFRATQPHRFAGSATHTGWAPDANAPDDELRDCWLLVLANGQPPSADNPAFFAVWDYTVTGQWTLIEPEAAPWFALSIAGVCRNWVNGDFTAPIRDANDDPALFKRPGKGELDVLPTVKDEWGNI